MIRIKHIPGGPGVPGAAAITMVCEKCGAEGPREIGTNVDDHWAISMAHAAGLRAGFTERVMGRVTRSFCASCTSQPGGAS